MGRPIRVGIVVPHMFMQRDILPRVIFSPGQLALDLTKGLRQLGTEVTLFTPGPVDVAAGVTNITADLSYFEAELHSRGDSYLDMLKKHPFTFITLARQVQAELLAKAFDRANHSNLDIIHIYTNEEDTALPFAKLCSKPVVFTHHDPFNFLVKYKNVFPKYASLNWISISQAQRQGMPADTNWVSNIYHGLDEYALTPLVRPTNDYIAYLGRLIQPKGAHLAIAAIQAYNYEHRNLKAPLKLKLAGKHYSGAKDSYWQESIVPHINDASVEYVGFIDNCSDKQAFLANAKALIIPSTFQEPFGMVMIEALACGTPVIGLDSGAICEVVKPGSTGLLVSTANDELSMIKGLSNAIASIDSIKRQTCRQDFVERFTLERMCREHLAVYQQLIY